jgi:hypothetical protein
MRISIASLVVFGLLVSFDSSCSAEVKISETLAWIESTYNNHLDIGGSPGHGSLET